MQVVAKPANNSHLGRKDCLFLTGCAPPKVENPYAAGVIDVAAVADVNAG